MKKIIATSTLAATALAGGIVLGPSLAGAQEDTAPETEESVERGDFVQDALAPLVADGTLTEGQADAVEDALQTARENFEGRRGHRGFGGGEALEELGLDRETVREGIAAGQNLGEIAEANGVSSDALVDALIAQAEERLDAAVEAGRLTTEEADEKAAEIEERVEGIVDGSIEPEGRRGRGFRGNRGFGPGPDADGVDADGEVTGS